MIRAADRSRLSWFHLMSGPIPQRTGAWRRLLQAIVLASLLPQLSGCATPAREFERLARRSCLEQLSVAGSGFEHLVYRTIATPPRDGLLFVYLEGDGRPANRNGTRPSADPTTRQPLALQLLAGSGRAGIYLTRPCYNGQHRAAGCDSRMWTSERYSEAVVRSLAAALEQYLSGSDAAGVVLVGYSGGGALAMLMASRISQLRGVITVAGNLDVAAWTRLHGYEPLGESLDPAAIAAPGVPIVHYVGERDRNVPPAILADYFASQPSATVLRMPGFDHRCCWIEQWPRLLDAALAQLGIGPAVSPGPAVP